MEILRKIKTTIDMARYTQNGISSVIKYLAKGSALVRLKDGTEVTIKKEKLSPMLLIDLIKRGWIVQDLGEDYLIKKQGIKLVQPSRGVLHERLKDIYSMNLIKGKTVLDVGGYFGETAIMFAKWGKAKKVLVFEPVPVNQRYIQENIKINNLEKVVSLYPYAVSNNNSQIEISSDVPPTSSAFGLKPGKYKLKVKAKSWKSVLNLAIKEKTYLAKVDCEGCESGLVDIPCNIILKVPNWIIETHSKEIEESILRKFGECGFEYNLIEEVNENPQVRIYKFFKA